MNQVHIIENSAGPVASSLLEIEAIKLNCRNPFTWSSGWKSPIYCDNRLSLSYPLIRTSIKDYMANAIREYFPGAEAVAGVATAGIPQGALVADSLKLPFLYVRPKPKDHGMQNLIEGKVDPGKRVVLIEDLVSTGSSSLKAAEALKDAGFIVEGMIAIFTYGFDVATRNFENAKIRLICLSDFEHLLPVAVEMNYIKPDDLEEVRRWRTNPSQWGRNL